MENGEWDPCCVRPDDLAWPVRVGREGIDGLSWRTASGPRFERVGRGLFVPAGRRRSVEQRIVDAAARLPCDGSRGVVTGWAALRWWGAAYFDGRPPHGQGERPVELLLPGSEFLLAPRPGVVIRRRVLLRSETEVVDGLPVASPQRALFDEIHRLGELWTAVQAIDMAAAAGLISAWLFATYLADANSMNGVPLAREAVSLAVDESRSPRETWLRLVWLTVARLPEPLVNEPVYDLSGRLLGVPDLFDPAAGLVCEYSGEVHKHRDRHRRDVAREADLRDHGLEYVEVVAGDSRVAAAARILAARSRAGFLPPGSRDWTLERPSWDPKPETLDERFDRLGLVSARTHR